MKNKIFLIGMLFLAQSQFSCDPPKTVAPEDAFIRAADLSALPEIESENTVFYNNNHAEDLLTTLKNAGCNTIRIRLWKNPSSVHSSLAEVKSFASRIKNAGMKVWLTVHYSDSWADPGTQTTPAVWQNMSFVNLKTEVSNYTALVLSEIHPDIYQIGNEINDGFLWPQGNLTSNQNQFIELLQAASTTIRNQSPTTKIMIHYAGISGASTFFTKMTALDYDYIGLSYYPIWHGKSLVALQNTIDDLGQTHNKKVLIAETSYPFTLGWNDWTNNIVGLDNQLIPGYSPTPEGQKNFLTSIKTILKASLYGQGFAYWGAELVAFRGTQATNGSPWENQALYDFTNNSLPVMQVFSAN